MRSSPPTVLLHKASETQREVQRNLKKRDSFYSICCLLGLLVSLPCCLRLWQGRLPLHLFLGGAQPDAFSLPGSKALHLLRHLQAIA